MKNIEVITENNLKEENYNKTLGEQLRHKVNKEIIDLKLSLANMTAEQFFREAYKVNFYQEMENFLISNAPSETLSTEVLKWLCEFEYPIAFLYEEILTTDGGTSYDWEDIIDFIKTSYEINLQFLR